MVWSTTTNGGILNGIFQFWYKHNNCILQFGARDRESLWIKPSVRVIFFLYTGTTLGIVRIRVLSREHTRCFKKNSIAQSQSGSWNLDLKCTRSHSTELDVGMKVWNSGISIIIGDILRNKCGSSIILFSHCHYWLHKS